MNIQGSSDYGFISMLLFVGQRITGRYKAAIDEHNEMTIATRLEF